MADLDEGLLGTLQSRLKESGREPIKEKNEPEFDDDLLVKAEDIASDHESDGLVEEMKREIGILDAYNKWANKGHVTAPPGRNESIKIRCPDPRHVDSNPSAWVNTDKDVFYCGGCGIAGDIFTIAALAKGVSASEYQSGDTFTSLKDKMAEDFGFSIQKSPGGQEYIEQSSPPKRDAVSEPVRDVGTPALEEQPNSGSETDEPEPELEGSTSAIEAFKAKGKTPKMPDVEPSEDAKIISITPRPGDADADPVTPSIDWRDMLPSGTFMRTWMEVTSKDDLPEEYYFWLGMQAVGLAVGNDMALADNPPVKGNIFICLYGPTGIGKSRATNATVSLLRSAFPFDKGDGVYQIPSPGSAEALIDAFVRKVGGDEDEGIEPTTTPITGLIRFDELSTLMGRAERAGSAMKPTLMEFFDSYNPVTHKTRGHGEVTAENHFASCITTTQPKAISELLTHTDADAGFVNRWLFATGVGKKPIAFGREDIQYDKAVPLLQNIHEWAKSAKASHMKSYHGGEFTYGAVGMTPEALELWSEFFHDMLVPNKKSDHSALLSRTDLMMKKIIALLAFDRQHMPVEKRDVSDAITLWEYLTQSYNMLAREIGVGVYEDCRHYICDIITEHKRRTGVDASPRDILRGVGSRFSSALVKSVLETLVSLGELREYMEDKDGRKIPRYVYVE